MLLRAASLLLALTPALALGSARAENSAGAPTVVFGGPMDLANNSGHLDHERRHALVGLMSAYPLPAGFMAAIELIDYSAGYDAPMLSPPWFIPKTPR